MTPSQTPVFACLTIHLYNKEQFPDQIGLTDDDALLSKHRFNLYDIMSYGPRYNDENEAIGSVIILRVDPEERIAVSEGVKEIDIMMETLINAQVIV